MDTVRAKRKTRIYSRSMTNFWKGLLVGIPISLILWLLLRQAYLLLF